MIDIAQLIQDVLNGNENPLKAYAILKELSTEIANAINEIEDYAHEEASKFGERSFETMDWKFEIREGSRRMSFKNIDQWNELTKQIKEKEALYKQATLAYEKGKTIVDENGEVVPVGEVSFTKPSLIVKRVK